MDREPESQKIAQQTASARANCALCLAIRLLDPCSIAILLLWSPLRGSAEQLKRFGEAEDIADLLFEIAVEIPINRNLRDEIEGRKVPKV